MPELSPDVRYRLLEALQNNPDLTQRELASLLGVSLGKMNYCLQALIEKGWVKARNFRNADHKFRYIYLLTPSGVEEKARVTVRFLKQRLAEVKKLQREVAQLRREVRKNNGVVRRERAG